MTTLQAAKHDFKDAFSGDTVRAKHFEFSISLANVTNAKIQLRDKVIGSLKQSFELDDGILVDGNIVTLEAFEAPEVSEKLKSRVYKWDLELTFSNGDVRTYIYGDFRVHSGATK